LNSRPKALDLFCRAGGVSEGLRRAGFDVVGVDILDCAKAYNKGPGSPEHENPARFVRADALTYPLEGFDLICASPPCQAHSVLRRLTKGKEYPELIPQTRERLMASGIPYAIENVPGSPLEGSLLVLCGTMFGLGTPDGRAELRRHRHFETSFPVTLRPECRHGRESLTVSGTGMGAGNVGKDAEMKAKRDTIAVVGQGAARGGIRHVITVTGDRCNSSNTPKVICVGGGKAMSGGMMTPQGELKKRIVSVYGGKARDRTFRDEEREERRRTVSVTGNTAQTNVHRNTIREAFSTSDARHAMGISWMAMKDLSQAIPPAYAHFIGLMFLGEDPTDLLVEGGCMGSLF
jgi:DNA (cytosine-5)-methyltransferase 1